MKNSPFDSLVWGSLRLAPIIVTFCSQNVNVRLTTTPDSITTLTIPDSRLNTPGTPPYCSCQPLKISQLDWSVKVLTTKIPWANYFNAKISPSTVFHFVLFTNLVANQHHLTLYHACWQPLSCVVYIHNVCLCEHIATVLVSSHLHLPNMEKHSCKHLAI